MSIKTPDDLVITDTLARGHRRHNQLQFIDKLNQLKGRSGPQKFGPYVRENWRRIQQTLGSEYAKVLFIKKREARFLLVICDPNDRLYGVWTVSLVRRTGPADVVLKSQNLILVSHFIERHIQLKLKNPEDFIVTITQALIHELERYIHGEVAEKEKPPEGVRWREWGSFAFATKNLLIFGNVPRQGNAVVKTVIHKTTLEEENRLLWRHLRQCKNHLKVGREL